MSIFKNIIIFMYLYIFYILLSYVLYLLLISGFKPYETHPEHISVLKKKSLPKLN